MDKSIIKKLVHIWIFLDIAVELMKASDNNAAVLNYAIKVLSGEKLTNSARNYCWKMSMHFCLLYPYLISLMEKYVFEAFKVPKDKINIFINKAFKDGVSNRNYEEASYAIYFAIKFDLIIEAINCENIVSSNDCIYKLISFLYYKKLKANNELKILREHALELKKNDSDMYRNWVFVYEVLSASNLNSDWVNLKRNGVSFLKPEFRF